MSAKVLIVEDNEANLELAGYLLASAGYTVVTATDGQQGYETARKELPNLIVCDLQMPVLDGFGFLKLVKNDEKLSRIPVVAVTAFSMPGDRDHALGAGFSEYMAKPIDPERFVAELEVFLHSIP